ncbi:MAG: glycine cleavage system aminomethyltransferase T [Planctomycetota bacterium]|jgi:glycine cleavage system aminomethyltransferase T
MNPLQAGLVPFTDLEKEGYIGREALLELDQRVLLLGLKTADVVPAYRAGVFDNSVAVGQVTAAAWSPTLECGIAYVRFNAADDWIGQTLSVRRVDDQLASCEIVALPFFDEQKKIPRGN